MFILALLEHSIENTGMEEALKEFGRILVMAQEILLQENSLLKAGKIQEHTALMTKKGEMLKELDAVLVALRQLRDQKTPGNKESIRNLQDKIMKLLILDKENSQLLLKQSNFSQEPKINAEALEKLYKNC